MFWNGIIVGTISLKGNHELLYHVLSAGKADIDSTLLHFDQRKGAPEDTSKHPKGTSNAI